MADFNRIVYPAEVSWPKFPPGLESWSHAGKGQFRNSAQVGRMWEEVYSLMHPKDPNTHEFLEYINNLLWGRTIFDIVHLDKQKPQNDPITGSMTVNGANQTGSTLNVTSTLNKVLRYGDFIKIAGLNLVYSISQTMSAGNDAFIKIFPPILAGNSPANSASITFTGVKLRAVITEDAQFPTRVSGKMYAGLTIKFRECP
ncbi:MAG: hypothetical protein NG747_13370 [Candidatus Brocadia sp.]|nr:hypothetical protein [Candidatus Brocadia sp.]